MDAPLTQDDVKDILRQMAKARRSLESIASSVDEFHAALSPYTDCESICSCLQTAKHDLHSFAAGDFSVVGRLRRAEKLLREQAKWIAND